MGRSRDTTREDRLPSDNSLCLRRLQRRMRIRACPALEPELVEALRPTLPLPGHLTPIDGLVPHKATEVRNRYRRLAEPKPLLRLLRLWENALNSLLRTVRNAPLLHGRLLRHLQLHLLLERLLVLRLVVLTTPIAVHLQPSNCCTKTTK